MNRNKKLNILIVDDEVLSCNRVQRLLRGDEDIGIVRIVQDGDEALSAVESDLPNLIFLDVQMPGIDGFEFLERVPKGRRPYVIFITAYENYAVQAFEVEALDYLLKPFSRRRFEMAMAKAKNAIWNQKPVFTHDLASQPFPERLVIRQEGELFFVKTSTIQWVQAKGRYVILHLQTGEVLKREGINSLEARLDPKQFLRVHRSHIVNIEQIKKLESWFHGDYRILLQDGTRLPLSRSFKPRVQQALRADSL